MIPIVLNIAVIAGLSWWLYARSRHEKITRFYWLFLSLKLLLGIALGLLYTHYYTGGDTFTFFKAGTELALLAKDDPMDYIRFWLTSDAGIITLPFTWTPNIFFAKVVSLFNLATSSNYWLISLHFSFISFTGAWCLARGMLPIARKNIYIVLAALFCLPSVAFWSSGLMKESLAMACIYGILAIFLPIYYDHKRVSALQVFLGIALFILLWQVKYYYAGLLFVALFSITVTHYVSRKYLSPNVWWLLLLFVSCSLIMFFGVSQLHPNFYLSRILQVLVDNHDAFVAGSSHERYIQFYELTPSWSSLLENSPLALVSGLFRPFVWEVHSVLYVVPALENMLLVLLAVAAIFYGKFPASGKDSILVMGVLMYSMVMAVFLAFSTPNFGTLMRYKIGFLPFLSIIFMFGNPLLRKPLY